MRRSTVAGEGRRREVGSTWGPADSTGADLDVLATLVRGSADGTVVLRADRRIVYANPAACRLLRHPLDELLSHDLFQFFPERARETALAFFAGARGGRSGTMMAVALGEDGAELDLEVTITRLDRRSGRLLVVVFRDVSERHRQARAAASLAQAAAGVAPTDSIEAIVQDIAGCAHRGTRALAVWLTLDDGHEIATWIGASGLPGDCRERVREAAGARAGCAAFLQALVAERVVVYADARRLVEREPGTARLAAALRSLPWQAAVFAPLVYRDAVIGVLAAVYRQGELPSGAETTFLATLAEQATMAAASVRLVTATRDRVALEERQRLARELHDSVSQALFGIELEARLARDRLERDPGRVAQPIDQVLRLAEAGQAEVRALIFELRPEALEREGLVACLDRQLEAIRSRHGIEAGPVAGDEPEAPPEVKQALYRIATEAIRNAARHARARRIEVRVAGCGAAMAVEIADDGVGFDPEQPFPGHLGLSSMRERALAAGGSLEVTSAPGRGTCVRASVPLA